MAGDVTVGRYLYDYNTTIFLYGRFPIMLFLTFLFIVVCTIVHWKDFSLDLDTCSLVC